MILHRFIISIITAIFVCSALYSVVASGVPDIFETEAAFHAVPDTIPLKDRDGDFINNPSNNPFDLFPNVITQEVEYDVFNDRYILTEKIGDEYFRPPTYMTFDEYMAWKAREQEREYFNSLAGIQSKKPSLSGKIDPMDKVDVSKSLVDRMFGGTEVNIKPQGSVDLTLGLVGYRKTEGPSIVTQRQSRQWLIPSDFRIQPRLNVDGSIGEKLNLGFNYDAQSTFNFDQKIKLDYSSDAFGEDDIIKKIEAGNVSFPLKGNLIQGAQSLFGFKTELQFGHLRITALASQQQSRQNNLKIENGASVQQFDITPDEYDENRNFFISHYSRDNYERALDNLPQINTSFRLASIEVYVTSDRRDDQSRSTLIAAVADIAEGDVSKLHDPNYAQYIPSNTPQFLTDRRGNKLPDNRQNTLFQQMTGNSSANEIDQVSQFLTTQFGMVQTRDFEVFQGRLLQPSEYTVHEQLGTVSLNRRLRPNEVMAVSYKYYYTERCDSIFTVGQLANEGVETSESLRPGENPEPPKVIFAKLIKPTNQQTTFPTWDLMMKNVYNLRTTQLTRDGFTFDIYYEDDFNDGSLKKYIPRPGLENTPLLNVFNLDTLNRFGDPQSDGVFDYVPGVTVIERTGSIVYPVLEPFGSSLKKLLGNSPFADSIAYNELYDTTIVIARQSLEKNKFIMRAEVESANSGEIFLGPNIPQGSVRVRAGGVELIEGQDYEIDYSLGRLRVLNPAYLSQATPIDVRFEDSGIFNLNNKSMMGVRLDYDFSKKFTVGATYLRLKERPFTQKVNVGEDPINNRIFGVDFNYNDDIPWMTTLVDKLPFYSTKTPSTIAVTAEAAYLRPGHNRNINLNSEQGGVVNIDDFEGAINGFTLGGFGYNEWTFASTPPEFPESSLVDNVLAGANRAKINWYQIDQSARVGGPDVTDPYTRQILVQDLFQRQLDLSTTNILYSFDISYYPNERGIYNFDNLDGSMFTAGVEVDETQGKVLLKDPKSRWGGIMRSFSNTDFEATNYEFIEFWVLNPFMERRDGAPQISGEEGEMVIHLGNVSEDIIKDNLQFYENAIPVNNQEITVPIRSTNWGRVSLQIPINNGFAVNNIEEQDLGLDGLDDAMERNKFEDYLNSFSAFPNTRTNLLMDPSGDNYLFYNDEELRQTETNLLNRLKGFNNPQGNSPKTVQQTGDTGNRFINGNARPESEDLNNNRSLDQAEAYHEYRLKLKNLNGELDTTSSPYYRQTLTVNPPNGPQEKWYRFQIPLNSSEKFNISGFRSIQFMRMYFTKFESAKTFRLADFQMVRNLWRKSDNICLSDADPSAVQFSVDKVGIEENTNRLPFNYRSPANIQRERITGTFGPLLLDEKSMVLRFDGLADQCQVAVNKLTRLNLTQYEKMQMFVHAEELDEEIKFEELKIFIKVGKDLVNNYYEYEMPLMMSDKDAGQTESNIWLDTNFINLELEKFLDVKKAKLAGTASPTPSGAYEIDDVDNYGAKIRVKGVPSLGYVKIIEVGVRNASGDNTKTLSGQVWINELRCSGLERRGGVAAQARAQIKMADLGDINLSTNYSSIGFGALDQKLQERNQEEIFQYDAATTLQLGKILPQFLKLNLPFYAQYSKSISTPRFDPYQLDLTTAEVLESTPDADKADVRERAREVTTIKSYNFTNVKVDVGSGKMPWDPKNFSGTYAWTEKEVRDPIIKSEKENETQIGLDYRFSMKPLYIIPFKFIKAKSLKLISEFNFNLIPNSFRFNTNLNRFVNTRVFRLPETPVFQFDDQRFKWDRDYNLDWDMTKSIRFTYKATTSSIVDELRQVGIANDPADRRWVNEKGEDFTPSVNDDPAVVKKYRNDNLKNLGRSKLYNHDITLSYRLPFKHIRILDWVSTTADYKAQYGWTGGPLITIDEANTLIGNVIQNGQTRSLNSRFDFDKLYGKSKYLKKIEGTAAPSRARTRTRPTRSKDGKDDAGDVSKQDEDAKKEERKRGEREPSKFEKILIRPLLSLRSVKFSYREDFGTVLPGFMNDASLLGLSEGFAAPGWKFATGWQPDIARSNPQNWLISNQQWFNNSPNFNEQSSQTMRHNINTKIEIEPFKDFDIDLDFNKDYRRDHTQIFKVKDINGDFTQQALYDVGNFEVTHIGLNTLFMNNEELLTQFRLNRLLISNTLPNKTGAGEHDESPPFAEGYGPLSNAVNVPAFLAAYTGKNINTVTRNLEGDVSSIGYIPKPNWQLRYDGLSKLKAFKNVFKKVQIKHGYKSTMGVSRFNTNPDYTFETRYSKKTDGGDYYSELDIPSLTINEQFNPIIGVSLQTISELRLNVEWKKGRRLDLQRQKLSEDSNNEFVFGFGYVIKDFKGFSKKKKRTRKKPTEEEEDAGLFDINRGGLVNNEKGKTVTLNLDVTYRDNINIIYDLTNGTDGQPNRGSTTLSIDPSVEYQMYKNLAIRWFAKYQSSTPKNSEQNSFVDFETGITARFTFN